MRKTGAAEEPQLKRSLNPMNIWALALGAIIGFGCFILPPDFLAVSGPLGILGGLALGALAMLVVGRNVSYMVERIPAAGGAFTFAYETFGKRHGYLCGWMLSLCYISLIAMNASALGVLAQYLFPEVFTRGYLYTVAGWDVYLPQILLAFAAVTVFGVFNYRGGQIAGRFQLGMVGLMIHSVLMILVGTLLSPHASAANLAPAFPEGVSPFSAILAMLALSPFLYVGFDTIPHAAEEFSFSSRKTFRLVAASIAVGGCIYFIVSICTAMVWPWEEMVARQYAWATGAAMEVSVGKAGVVFLAVAICMGIFTGINGFYLASSRLLLSMSREGILSPWFSKVHETYRTPSHAILAAMAVSLVAPFFGRKAIGWVVDMCSCGTAIAYLYTCAAAYVISARERKAGRRELAPWLPVCGFLCSVLILALLLLPGSPGAMGKESWICLVVWLLAGSVFHRVKGGKD